MQTDYKFPGFRRKRLLCTGKRVYNITRFREFISLDTILSLLSIQLFPSLIPPFGSTVFYCIISGYSAQQVVALERKNVHWAVCKVFLFLAFLRDSRGNRKIIS